MQAENGGLDVADSTFCERCGKRLFLGVDENRVGEQDEHRL